MTQIKEKNYCTKSQLEYLILYNEIQNYEEPYFLDGDLVAKLSLIDVDFGNAAREFTLGYVAADQAGSQVDADDDEDKVKKA
jgi:hypothetical protein